MKHILVLLSCSFLLSVATGWAEERPWRAGAARVNITPAQFMPMSGYASRGVKHADGKLTDLWAKAVVLEDAAGRRAVLITYDLIGIDRGLSRDICAALAEEFQLQREQVALNFSHTHTGPVVAKNLRPMHYMLLDEANRKLVDEYADFVQRQTIAVVGEAIADLSSAKLSWGKRRGDVRGESAEQPRTRD